MTTTIKHYSTKIGYTIEDKKLKKEKAKWFAFYTCPRAEKIVHKDLLSRGYEAFLPVKKEMHVWKNRQKKEIDIPLFPNYIFAKVFQHEIYNVSRINKIVTCISFGGTPSSIDEKKIETIQKMLSLKQDVMVEQVFCEGEKVKIVAGPLTGYEGILVKQKGKTCFGIHLKEITHTVFIDICHSVLMKTDE